MSEGAAIHNGTHISMPEAQVRVNLTRTGNTILTDMRAEFSVTTNITQNTTLGFVIPKLFSYSSNYASNLSILLNNTRMDYQIIQWGYERINETYPQDLLDELGYWLLNANYAIFDIELQANVTKDITVISTTSQDLNVNSIEYTYIIASARTFEGDTHETVQIQLIENTPFLGFQFSPDINLNITTDGICTNAIWDFNVSEFGDVSVRLHAEVNEYQPHYPPIDLFWILFDVGVIAIILVPVVAKIVYQRKQMP
jgi:hypothetical protein